MAKPFKHKRKQEPNLDRLVFQVLRAVRASTTADLARETGLSGGCISKLRTRRTLYPRLTTAHLLLEAVGARLVVMDADEVLQEAARRRAKRKAKSPQAPAMLLN